MHDLQLVQVHYSLHDVYNNECTFELVEEFSLLHILIKIFTINVLGDDVLMGFGVNCVYMLDDLGMV